MSNKVFRVKSSWALDGFGFEINSFELIKETPKQVVYKDEIGKERRVAKHSYYESFFSSEEEALQRIQDTLENNKKNAEQALNEANSKLEEFIKYKNENI